MLNKNNQNQKIVAKKMEAKKHFRSKLPTNLHETFHIYLKKSRNYDSHKNTHIAKIDQKTTVL